MHRIYYWPKISSFFSFPWGFIYWRCRNNVLPLVISDYFHETTNQFWIENSKMTGLNDCKSFQENVSLSLTKRKLAEKNEWKFPNQSSGDMYAFIYPRNRKRSFFFSLSYLEYNFMIANLVRFNLAVPKILEASQEHSRGGVLC